MKLMRLKEKSFNFTKIKGYKGDLYHMLNGNIKYDNSVYNKLKTESFCKTPNNDIYTVECKNKNGYNKRLFILRDSFSTALLPFLGNTFKKIKTYHYNHHKISTNDLNFIKNNFDIVILENVERYIPLILTLNFPQ